MVKTAKYHVFIEVIPVDHNKYTYNFKVSKWEVTTKERYYSQSGESRCFRSYFVTKSLYGNCFTNSSTFRYKMI